MLVLTREPKEGKNSIMLGDNIEVIVVRVRGDAVRLGIVAHESISVKRGELVHKFDIDGKESEHFKQKRKGAA